MGAYGDGKLVVEWSMMAVILVADNVLMEALGSMGMWETHQNSSF